MKTVCRRFVGERAVKQFLSASGGSRCGETDDLDWDVGTNKALAVPRLRLPWRLSGKESPAGLGAVGSISGSGRSSGEENGHPLQYPCLGNPMDRGAWWATGHGVAKEDLVAKQVPQLTLELDWPLSDVPSWAEGAESPHRASSSSQPILYGTEDSPQRDSAMSSQQPMLPAAGGRGT